MRSMLHASAAVTLLAASCATGGERAATTTSAEEIYVVRTHRTSRIEGATPACAAAPFAVRQEDYYALFATATDDRTGLVTDAAANPAGGFAACLGPFDGAGFDMLAIGAIGELSYTSLNRCAFGEVDHPVEGGILLHCWGEMQEPPEGYAEGFFTSSTLAPLGEASELPGYTTTSIVTVPLWRATGG